MLIWIKIYYFIILHIYFFYFVFLAIVSRPARSSVASLSIQAGSYHHTCPSSPSSSLLLPPPLPSSTTRRRNAGFGLVFSTDPRLVYPCSYNEQNGKSSSRINCHTSWYDQSRMGLTLMNGGQSCELGSNRSIFKPCGSDRLVPITNAHACLSLSWWRWCRNCSIPCRIPNCTVRHCTTSSLVHTIWRTNSSNCLKLFPLLLSR